jgi:hypothetical protein
MARLKTPFFGCFIACFFALSIAFSLADLSDPVPAGPAPDRFRQYPTKWPPFLWVRRRTRIFAEFGT